MHLVYISLQNSNRKKRVDFLLDHGEKSHNKLKLENSLKNSRKE